jgi:hypothetical protein
MTTDAKRAATFLMNSDVMTVTLRHADGSVHFSDLKWFAKSPMHYEDAILSSARDDAADARRYRHRSFSHWRADAARLRR